MTSALTQLLLAHHAAGTTIGHLPAELVPADLAGAYQVQNETLAALGPVGAWKVSPYPADGEPACSPLPRSYVHQSGATLPARNFPGLGVEVEIAITLGEDLAAGASVGDAQSAIGTVNIALELIASRFTDRKSVSREAAFADLQSSGGLVLGEAVRLDSLPEFGTAAVVLTLDGIEAATTPTGPATENALRAIAWLASHAAARGMPLTKGTVIITGARLGPIPFSGKTAEAASPNLGTVSVRFQH